MGARRIGLLALTAAAALSIGCVQVQAGDGGFVMGRSMVVEEGEVAREDLVAVGGSIRIDGEARRDVVVIGGRLTINGEVGGEVVCIGGTMVLGPRARVGSDAVVVGGEFVRDPAAQIDGEVVTVSFGRGFGSIFHGYSPIWWGGLWGFSPFAWVARTTQLFYWLLLALLTVALVGDRVSSASHAVAHEPLRLGAIGLVGFLALCCAFLVLLILSVVIIGIPFLIALIFGWWLGYVFGVVAVFQAVGARVMRMAGRPEASQLAIVLAGALVLGIVRYVPFGFGSLIWVVAALVGFGSVFATRFGSGRSWLSPPVGPPPPQPAATGRPAHPPAPPAGAEGGDRMEFDRPADEDRGYDEDFSGAEDLVAPEEGADDEERER